MLQEDIKLAYSIRRQITNNFHSNKKAKGLPAFLYPPNSVIVMFSTLLVILSGTTRAADQNLSGNNSNSYIK